MRSDVYWVKVSMCKVGQRIGIVVDRAALQSRAFSVRKQSARSLPGGAIGQRRFNLYTPLFAHP
jgi:hypothetical protein